MYQLIIADDEFEIASGIANYFPWEEIGFEVVSSFSNGQEVLTWLRKHSQMFSSVISECPLWMELNLQKKFKKRKYLLKSSSYPDTVNLNMHGRLLFTALLITY